MTQKTSTRDDTARLLRECLHLVEAGRPCEISIVVDESGAGRFSIVITGRAHTLDGIANPDDIDTAVIHKRGDTEDT